MIKWEYRHCMRKDWDIARLRRNTQRRTGSWTLLSLSVNASMKWDQLSPENQAEVDPDRFIRQRWSNKLVNWFVRKKTSQGQARAPERSLNNWTFIYHSFNALWNVTFKFQLSAFRHVPAQIISESVKQKRHERCKKLTHRLPVKFAKKVFYWWKKLLLEASC